MIETYTAFKENGWFFISDFLYHCFISFIMNEH